MNKKVALSVLSATVFASMAASAFAAPKSGLYIGGNVDKYYSMDTLFKMDSATADRFSNEIGSAGFSNLIYVDFDGRGASIAEIMAAPDFDKAKQDLKADKFEGEYTSIKADGSEDGKYDPRKDANPVDSGELKVDSVTATNAKTLVVKFGTKVDPNTSTSGALNPANYFIDNQDLATWDGGTPDLELSEDGKSVTITLDAKSLAHDTSYAVVVKGIKDFNLENDVPVYTTVLKFSDNVRPQLAAVSYKNAVTAKINFTEALSTKGSVTVLDAAGKDVTATATPGVLSADGKSFTVDLSSNTLLNNVNYTVKIVGAADLAGNLIDPNPATVTIKKQITETTPPVATAVKAVGPNKVEITYSEKLSVPGTVEVAGSGSPLTINTTAVTGNATVDATGLVYTVKLDGANTPAAGLRTVVVDNFVDENGNANAEPVSKAVTFTADDVAPAYVSSEVKAISGKSYLLVKFDDTFTASEIDDSVGAITGTYVDKDGIEQTANITVAGKTSLYDTDRDGKSDTIQIELPAASSNYGDYSVTLPAGIVSDTAPTPGPNASLEKDFTFTYNTGAVDPTKLTVSSPSDIATSVSGDNNIVTVQFNKSVDKATALNVSNYLVDGVAAFEKAVFDGDNTKVKLTLKAGIVTDSGNHLVTVKNVKDLANTAMVTVNHVVNFNENVNPTVTSVDLTAPDQLTITFSEAIKTATIVAASQADAENDFGVKAGSTIIRLEGTVAAVAGSDDKKFTVKLAAPLTVAQAGGTVTLQVYGTNDIVDKATVGNGVKAVTKTVNK